MIDDEQLHFEVVDDDEHKRFIVVNDTGRTIVVCRDRHSADEYAVILNEAWRRGFKAGYREGRAKDR